MGVTSPAVEDTLPARVLALQQSHGNAAVARMIAASSGGAILARDPTDAGAPPAAGVPIAEPRPGDAEDMDRAIGEYLWINDFRNAARILNGFNQADIDKRIKGYTVQQRNGLYDAVETNGGAAIRIRAPIDLGRALDARDWAAAVRVLDTYPEIATRVPGQLRGMGWKEEAHLLGAAESGHLAVAAQMRPVVAERSADIAAALPDQVAGPNPAFAAEMLNALTDADSAAAIKRLTAAQLFDINAASTTEGLTHVTTELAAEPYAGLIKVEGWDRRLRDSLKRKDWLTAAITLAMYPDDGVRKARLQWLNLDEATAIAELLRSGGSALYKLVEARRIEKLGQEYDAALRNKNWGYACLLLNAYDDKEFPARAQQMLTIGGVAGIAAAQFQAQHLFADDNNRVRRVLAYFLVQNKTGAAARPTHAQGWTVGAAAGPGVAVDGGTVKVYEAVSGGGAATMFAFDYRGAHAEETGWLQFVGEEIERFDAATAGNSLGYFEPSAPLHGTGQPNEPIEWNTASDRHWYLDAFSDQMPFYESPVSASPPAGFAAAGTRGSHSTVPSPAATPANGQTMMVDSPGSPVNYVHDAFKPIHSGGFLGMGGKTTQVKRVEHRVQFHEYLVRYNQVLYENTMTVTFTYTSDPGASGSAPAPTNKSGTGRTATKLQDEHFRALLRRFPAWGFYAH
ncbi:MAG: hypothetical protein ACXVHB_28525 [Solirubrobacteraceae bacterium]